MVTKIKPKALGPGAHIRIVSPASPITPEKNARGLQLLEDQGYSTSIGDHAYDSHYYLAGNDRDRAADLMAAFTDDSVDCVFCARGGYGCARLLPYLDLDVIANSGKAFCGFSDVTTLHLALNKRGLVTLHTPMLITLSVDREPWVIESFLNILKGENPIPSEAKRAETITSGSAGGEITGGCMCLITDSIGTANSIDCKDKIVIIEDVEEAPHRVDAMLTHLLNTGQLQSAAGIVFGEMTGTDEKADPTIGPWPWKEIIRDRVANLGIPAMMDFPFGHMKTMLSIPFGVQAEMNADSGTLKILESHCSG
ncbi:MAG: LD-carboxypeptidase [Armatimonadetes bacterium]|nr:LD-carboxypeptidase [Armatimonadota bacterium]